MTELPPALKNLYRHWHLHTGQGKNAYPKGKIFNELERFIGERLKIWKKKGVGEAPYTTDPIFAKYRFCNIFREFDRQTIEFHTLLNPLRGDFPLWLLNMFYCRMVARPETIRELGLLIFNDNSELYRRFVSLPRPKFGSPYIFPISVIQRSETPTRELFLTKYLPEVIKRVAKEIQNWEKMPVYDGAEKILPIFGFNLRFLWTEVLIDVAYQYPERIDLFGRFPIGPGALPTQKKLNYEVEKLAKMSFDTGITYSSLPLRLSAENWEGIFCEFRKYTNLKSGRGRKRLYQIT